MSGFISFLGRWFGGFANGTSVVPDPVIGGHVEYVEITFGGPVIMAVTCGGPESVEITYGGPIATGTVPHG